MPAHFDNARFKLLSRYILQLQRDESERGAAFLINLTNRVPDDQSRYRGGIVLQLQRGTGKKKKKFDRRRYLLCFVEISRMRVYPLSNK